MKLIKNKYNITKVNFLMKLIVFMLIIFVTKPVLNTLNTLLDNSDEISLLIDNELKEDENSEEELEEIEESEKILQIEIDVILHQKIKGAITNNIQLSSEFEYKIIDPPPEFIL
jgi:single-stranded DNA-specific DHH superfamily exonuclease